MKQTLLIALLCAVATGLMSYIGCGTSLPVAHDTIDPSLSIITPNGGEEWYIGDINNVTWTASDPNLITDPVYLWYSLNGGAGYTSLASGIANSGSFPWSMPTEESYNASVRIKVSDTFGNYSQKTSATPFSITYVPPKAPAWTNINTTNGIDAAITWAAVTENVHNVPITPDGYIVLYNESPYENDEHYYYYLWDVTSGTSFTHGGVMRRRGEMFYRVVAYQDITGRLADILQKAKADPSTKLSLAEIKRIMAAQAGGDR